MINSLVTKTLKAVLSLSSKTMTDHKLWILIFHRVLEKSDPLYPGEIDRVQFDQQMCLLAEHFNVLSLKGAVDRLSSGELPSRAVAITFDDGYADNLSIATPILKKYNLPATVFVSTGFLDGGRMWNDTVIESVRNWPDQQIDLSDLGLGSMECRTEQNKRDLISNILNAIKYRDPQSRQKFVDELSVRVAGLPTDLMLTTDGVRELHTQGIEIGAHTVSHPILASLDCNEAQREIAQSKEQLEEVIGERVRFFAYPNGRYQSDYNQSHVDMLRSLGFEAGLSTHWGVATHATDKMQLPRFTPWDNNSLRFMVRAAQNYQRVI